MPKNTGEYGRYGQANNTQGRMRKYGGPGINYDHSKMSNLPENPHIVAYPHCPSMPMNEIRYDITEADMQLNADLKDMRRYDKGDALK